MQLININWNKRSVLAHRYSVLGEKTGHILLLLLGLMVGREAGREGGREADLQAKCGWVLKFLKFKLFRLLFCLLSQQCYYSIRIAFQSAFVK